MRQIELYHRCRSNQCYRYVNPFSVLVTRDNKILLLDLDAESNEFVLRNMQKRAMRNHFVKPIIHIRENTKVSLDLYGYGKTIQFILANTKVEPSLTKREENRLEKIIEKCLGENPKKQYEDFRQIQKDLPVISNWNQNNRRKWIILAAVAGIAVILAVLAVKVSEKQEEKIQTQQNTKEGLQENETTQQNDANNSTGITKESLEGAKMRSGAGMKAEKGDDSAESEDKIESLETEVDGLQEYLLRNTAKDNQEIIEQGEAVLRELLRYLSAAYDREGMTEEALAAYEALCGMETQTELLKSAYLRRISIEMEQRDEGKAIQIGKEAVERFPELEESEVFQKLEETYGVMEKEDVDAEKDENPSG